MIRADRKVYFSTAKKIFLRFEALLNFFSPRCQLYNMNLYGDEKFNSKFSRRI